MARVADQSKFEDVAPPAEPDGQAGATRYGWYVLSILFLSMCSTSSTGRSSRSLPRT